METTSYNILGLKIDESQISNIETSLMRTYDELDKNPEQRSKWANIDFCSREIALLWDAVIDIFEKNDEEVNFTLSTENIRDYLIVDSENETFLKTYGDILRRSNIDDLLEQIIEIETGQGSLFMNVRGSDYHFNVKKILSRIFREADKVRNALKQHVDSLLRGLTPYRTCFLIGGIVTIAFVSLIFCGAISIPLAKILLTTAIAILCTFAEA